MSTPRNSYAHKRYTAEVGRNFHAIYRDVAQHVVPSELLALLPCSQCASHPAFDEAYENATSTWLIHAKKHWQSAPIAQRRKSTRISTQSAKTYAIAAFNAGVPADRAAKALADELVFGILELDDLNIFLFDEGDRSETTLIRALTAADMLTDEFLSA